MIHDILHRADEFLSFPWDEFTMAEFNCGDWGLSRGGHPVPDGRWCLQRMMDKSINVERWELPEQFSKLLDYCFAYGKEEALANVRKVLGIQC